MIRAKRVYEPETSGDGERFLVDRLWPRGITKENLRIRLWLRDVAPSRELRGWFAHDPGKWEEFERRYFAELDRKPEALKPIRDAARQGDVTLLFSAKDPEHNNAVALQAYLRLHKGTRPKR